MRLRRCRRRRSYAPTSNVTGHDNHEKINSWVSFSFPYEYEAPLGGPLGRRSSANKGLVNNVYPDNMYRYFISVYLAIVE